MFKRVAIFSKPKQPNVARVASALEAWFAGKGIGVGAAKEADLAVVVGGDGTLLAAARALINHTKLTPREIAEQAMLIAAGICVFTNTNFMFEEL